ncbi:MAG: beta-Ala-His dipeptidase [Selenomonadaceae bacterium]|nr:beta-Ala-His dipeptidase [Selenomonadaceae bacterium]
MPDDEILEGVLAEFAKLAAIPRPSGHEKAVSDFLKKYLTDLGLTVIQDENYNIVANAAATPGLEKAPLVILQGHMDMVCVTETGGDYSPRRDPIKIVRDEKYLRAEGTSLGADDGIGISEAVYIVKNLREHGALRLIFTVDEERGMTGAEKLDAKYLTDAAYLINCDSENYDELVVGSAGNVTMDFWQKITAKEELTSSRLYKISVEGLKGGHSGERINDGRGNAIRIMAFTLLELGDKGKVELISLQGGMARNVIPGYAEAVIATDIPPEKIEAILQEETARFRRTYGQVEPGIAFKCAAIDLPGEERQAFTPSAAQDFLRFLTVLHTGVYAMSPLGDGLVETSANLGVVQTTPEEFRTQFLPRSSSMEKLEEFCLTAKWVAEKFGLQTDIDHISPGWRENPHSRLAKLMQDIFEEQNGKPMKVTAIHAGLECGWHLAKNPNLDIVSVGVTTENIHSPKERLVLSTVAPQVRLIMTALTRIAKEA